MKVKFNVGAEFDVLSKDELDDSLDKSAHTFAKIISDGIQYGKSSTGSIASATASGNYTGGVVALSGRVGPNPGYVWSVKNLTYFGMPSAGADLMLNGQSFSDVVYAAFNGTNVFGTTIVGSNGLIIPAGNDLYIGLRGTVTSAVLVFYYEEVKLEDIGKL